MRPLVLTLSLVACQVPVPAADPDPASPPPPRVGAAEATADCVGVIVAEQASMVSARVDGKLADVRVRPGDRVRAGEIIATVDAFGLHTEVDAAAAALVVARAEKEGARLDASEMRERAARTDQLRTYVPEQESASARYQEKHAGARLRRARADILAAEARVKQAQGRLADAEIRAPFDGVVAARYVDPGATVTAMAPIVRLIAAELLRVRFAVPEARAAVLAPGDRVQVRVDWLPASVPATVVAVAPEVDAAAGLVFVEAHLADGVATSRIPVGVAVRVRLAG